MLHSDEEKVVVARALASDPYARWPHCRAFVEALAVSLNDPTALPWSSGEYVRPKGPPSKQDSWSDVVPSDLDSRSNVSSQRALWVFLICMGFLLLAVIYFVWMLL